MKLLVSISLILLCFSFPAVGQGIDFFPGSFEEATEMARQEEKLIFVDAYTTWCGPCKRMKKYIFPNKLAGDFYNKYFINMAIDMESPMGREFNARYPVRGYPSFLFINEEGELVLKEVGAKPIELFIDMGERALKADDRTEKYAKMYDAGNRDFDFMLKYVTALNRLEKPSSAIVYDYLNNGPNLSETDKARFVFESTCCCDSKLFEMMTAKKTKKEIISLYSEEVYEQKIEEACWATVKKGFQYNITDLYEEAKDKYKQQLKKKYPKFEVEVDLAIAKRNLNASEYLKAAKKYTSFLDDAEKANLFAIESKDVFLRDEGIAEFSESLSRSYVEKENSIQNQLYYAKILLKNKKYAEAVNILVNAIEKADADQNLDKMQELKQLKNMAENMLKSF